MILKEQAEIRKIIFSLESVILNKIPDAKKIADIGCAKGELLQFIHKEFSKPKRSLYGYDISPMFIKQAKDKFRNAFFCDFSKDVNINNQFDLIFALDIIEHIDNPYKFLENIKSILKKDGLFVLSTPNINSLSAFLQGPKWFAYKDKAHIVFYTKKSLIFLLKKSGLTTIKLETLSSSRFKLYNKIVGFLGVGGQIILVARRS